MATFELAKTIEARKLNPRSKLPLPEPPATIPYGAVLTEVEWLDDRARFHYLGEPYQCEEEVLREALGRELSAKEEPPAPAAEPETEPVPEPARPAAPETETRQGVERQREALTWEKVPSDRFRVRRASIPGGWLVWVEAESGAAVTFLPDPGHDWAV
ncbi:MAG TPA: hypothetical protein ENJ62_01240 [Bryobacterales bacterium]|nr:hypothetical protein [Bryobacterales bacterium]